MTKGCQMPRWQIRIKEFTFIRPALIAQLSNPGWSDSTPCTTPFRSFATCSVFMTNHSWIVANRLQPLVFSWRIGPSPIKSCPKRLWHNDKIGILYQKGHPLICEREYKYIKWTFWHLGTFDWRFLLFADFNSSPYSKKSFKQSSSIAMASFSDISK